MARYLLVALLAALPFGPPQQPIDQFYRAPSGITLRLTLDSKEISMGEMTFPANLDSGDHRHQSTEILYVLSGELEHSVNGKMEKLMPGMTGLVRPPDAVRHKAGPAGAKVLVTWVPGDEAQRIASRWTRER
jgi:quercetin dioxygenase-like cupin family protein